MNDQVKQGMNVIRAVLVSVFYAGAALGAAVGALAVMVLR